MSDLTGQKTKEQVATLLASGTPISSWLEQLLETLPIFILLTTTGAAGIALINGTPVLLTWTAPNDGRLHRVFFFLQKVVTSNETGGQINLQGSSPNLAGQPLQIIPGGLTTGTYLTGVGGGNISGAIIGALLQPAQVVQIAQAALTAGASTVYGEIWGL